MSKTFFTEEIFQENVTLSWENQMPMHLISWAEIEQFENYWSACPDDLLNRPWSPTAEVLVHQVKTGLKTYIADTFPNTANAVSTLGHTLTTSAPYSCTWGYVGSTTHDTHGIKDVIRPPKEMVLSAQCALRAVLNINIKNEGFLIPSALPSCDVFRPGSCSLFCTLLWAWKWCQGSKKIPLSLATTELNSGTWHDSCIDAVKSKDVDSWFKEERGAHEPH